MRVQILGPLQVLTDRGDDVTPRGAKQRRVVVALAAAGEAGVSVDRLEAIVWPDGAAPSTNALQATISKLRKALAPAVIEGDGNRYWLREVDTDLAEFDAACRAERWADVERLVHGSPAADIDDDDAVALRLRVDAALRTAKAHRLEAVVEGAAPSSAVAELEALVAGEPYDEGWWAKLMIAHFRSGRQAEALSTYQRARRVLADELGLEPGPELRRTEQRVLAHDEGAPPAPAGSAEGLGSATASVRALPARVGSFVGRERELTELAARHEDHRLVTIVGPGGAGKTSLALELCRRGDGEVTAVMLASAADREGVVGALAGSLGLHEREAGTLAGSGDLAGPLDRVTAALRARTLTIVVDNCEQVVEAAAEVVHRLLTECPGVRVVATSREPLGVPGEHLFGIPPLVAEESVELFVDRARDHGVEIGPDDRAVVAEVCERLDGLPLAIELAAARARTTTIGDLRLGLADRFALLDRGPRFAEPRQRTLRAVVDWSHDLLDDDERVVFRRLAGFAGGASPRGILSTCAGTVPETGSAIGGDLMEIVDRLVDKSLVRAEHTPTGIRYTMLQTLLDYAGEKLSESGERERVLVRHARFVADEVAGARHGLIGADQATWYARVTAERPNIEGAIGTAVAIGDAQLALDVVLPIGWYYYMAGEFDRGIEAFEAVLGCDGDAAPGDRAIALAHYSWLLANGPRIELAISTATTAMSMIGLVDDPWARAMIANFRAMAMFFAGDLTGVAAFLPDLDRIADEAGDHWIRAMTDVVKGEHAQFVGDHAEARRLFELAAAEFDRGGDRFAYALATTEASELLEQIGDYDAAAAMLERGLSLADEFGFSGHPMAMRSRLGNVEILRGNLEAAERHHRELIEDVRARGVPWLETMSRIGLSAIARRLGRLDEADRELALAWEIPRTRSVPYMRVLIQVARGYLADQRGDPVEALGYQSASLDDALEIRAPRGVAYVLEGVAGALALSSDVADLRFGAELLGCAHQMRVDSGGPMPPAERFDVDRAEGRLRAALGDEDFVVHFDAGCRADPDRVISRVSALAAVGHP